MGTRRKLTLEDREEIALARTRGEGVCSIARLLGRHPSVVSREIDRNTSKRGYRTATAHQRAKTRRSRPQHQPYLTAIAEELNNRPRACLGFYTSQEKMQQFLLESRDKNQSEGVASTS